MPRISLNAKDVRNLLNNRREWNVVFVKITIASPVLSCPKVPLMLYIVVVMPPLRERLRTHKVFTKDQCFYLNYHKFCIKSYVLDVY